MQSKVLGCVDMVKCYPVCHKPTTAESDSNPCTKGAETAIVIRLCALATAPHYVNTSPKMKNAKCLLEEEVV